MIADDPGQLEKELAAHLKKVAPAVQMTIEVGEEVTVLEDFPQFLDEAAPEPEAGQVSA